MKDARADADPSRPLAQIRWSAVIAIPICWFVITVFVRWQAGESLPRAAAIALVGPIGGLGAWALYHAISGRSDGLIILCMPLIIFAEPKKYERLPLEVVLTRRLHAVALVAISSCVIGLLLRLRSRRKQVPPDASSLWDAEVDPPRP